jgi:hypothetical protein
MGSYSIEQALTQSSKNGAMALPQAQAAHANQPNLNLCQQADDYLDIAAPKPGNGRQYRCRTFCVLPAAQASPIKR